MIIARRNIIAEFEEKTEFLDVLQVKHMFSGGDGMRKKNTFFRKIYFQMKEKTIYNFHCKCHQDDRISYISQFLNFIMRNILQMLLPQEKENVIES